MQIILAIIKQIFRGENNRNNIIGFVFSVLFLIVIFRMFDLQILKGEYYEQNYVQKSVKTISIPAKIRTVRRQTGLRPVLKNLKTHLISKRSVLEIMSQLAIREVFRTCLKTSSET